jgi:hypothetical protein
MGGGLVRAAGTANEDDQLPLAAASQGRGALTYAGASSSRSCMGLSGVAASRTGLSVWSGQPAVIGGRSRARARCDRDAVCSVGIPSPG